MSSPRRVIAWAAFLFTLISGPARSETTVYSWQDESGAVSFSDNPANALSDAGMKVFAQAEEIPVSETGPATQVVAPPPEALPPVVTQGEFAVSLAEELGLAQDPTEEEAADLLTAARISPILGEWDLDQPMSPELTTRLRRLTVAAADRGWITLSPEQGLLAFDTASALMGLTIPVRTEVEETSYAPAAPLPIADTPPLVYVEMPPPAVYPYYVWTPVAGGFWWNGFALPGYFVLDVNVYILDHHRNFRGRPVMIDPGHIRHRFQDRAIDHPVRVFPRGGHPERIDRPGFHPGPGRGADRVIEPPARRDPGMRHPGPDQPKVRPDKRRVSPEPATVGAEIRRPPGGRTDRTPHEIKVSLPQRPGPRTEVRSTPRPVEDMPRVKRAPSVDRTPEINPPSPRPRDSRNIVRPAPPRNPPVPNVSAAVPVPRPPSPPVERRFIERPVQNGPDITGGRGPAGR